MCLYILYYILRKNKSIFFEIVYNSAHLAENKHKFITDDMRHKSVCISSDGKGERHMQITDIRIRKINVDSKMKAVVSVTFDNAMVVHDIKVIEGADKLFIAMPSRKTPEGEFKDIAHPITMEMREDLEKGILEKYQTALLAESEV